MLFILNRYFLKSLLVPFFVCCLGFFGIFLISAIHNDLGDFSLNSNIIEIISYFFYLQLKIVNEFIPISAFLGSMYCLGNFNYNREIIAMRSAGISLFKVTLPILIFSLLLGLFILINNEYIIPYANKKLAFIKQKLYNYEFFHKGQFTYFDKNKKRQWIYDSKNKKMINIYIYQFDKNSNLEWDLYAKEASFDKDLNKWNFFDGIICNYDNGIAIKNKYFDKLTLLLKEKFKILLQQKKVDDKLTIKEILVSLDNTDKNEVVQKLKTMLYYNFVSPFIPLIAVIIAIIFSVTNNRYTKITTMALSIFIMLIFIILLRILYNIGISNLIHPLIAAAGVPAIFFIFGVILFYHKN